MTHQIPNLGILALAQVGDGITVSEISTALRNIANYGIVSIGGEMVTPTTIAVVGLMILVAASVSRMLQSALGRAFDRRGVEKGTAAVTKRLVHYAIMGVGLTLAIQQVGINLNALFAAGAIFAVGLGFAMQNIAENFVSGLILLVERTIKPSDIVEVDGSVLKVLKMGIRTTVARTRDDEEILIPNASLVQSAVKNYTLDDPLYRIRVVVGVSYDSDMRRVRSVLESAGGRVDWRAEAPAPVILLTDFGSSSVDWEVSVWCTNVWHAPRLASSLREEIWEGLKESGIVIAFPQLDLHLDTPVEDALTRVPRLA